jgi:hypothetical protein
VFHFCMMQTFYMLAIDVLTNLKCQIEELLHEIHFVNLLPTSTSFNITNNKSMLCSQSLQFL